jgi:hypothetical protein
MGNIISQIQTIFLEICWIAKREWVQARECGVECWEERGWDIGREERSHGGGLLR